MGKKAILWKFSLYPIFDPKLNELAVEFNFIEKIAPQTHIADVLNCPEDVIVRAVNCVPRLL